VRLALAPRDSATIDGAMKVRAVVRSAAIWGGFAGIVAVAVPPMLLGYPLVLVDPKRALSDWYFRTIAKALVGVNPLWRVEVEGKDKLRSGGPFVLVVNHQSFADLIAVSFLDHPTKYLGKAAVFDVPVFGWALRIAGEVPVVRGDRESGKDAVQHLGEWLDRGVSVTVFPEGTRSDDGAIGAFKHGAFRLAIAHRRPIVPVVLTGARDLLPKHSLLFDKAATIRLRVLDPVSTAGLGEADAAALADDVRARMVEAFGAMQTPA
jgi:1-acyl-sn-glycerol-3-phosphate acyltransferase